LKNNKLKKINLPILSPQGGDFPEYPDEKADTLIVISNGNWHGIIACSELDPTPQSMVKFKKRTNGDIAGTGFLENGDSITLLDSLVLLRREGFLLVSN